MVYEFTYLKNLYTRIRAESITQLIDTQLTENESATILIVD